MTFNFLLQATRILHNGNHAEDELKMIYEYINIISDDTLNDYKNTCTILSYENDLELLIEITNSLIKIYENKEEYEFCHELMNRKSKCENLLNTNTI